MLPLIEILNKDCKTCYACVRLCPVRAIQIKENQRAPVVINDLCIGCGDCVKICPQEIIKVRDSKDETKALLESENKVAAILAPSIAAEFIDIADYRKFVKMIKTLGFDYVNEVSFGVDLVAFRYLELFTNFKGKYYIAANCPVVVSYIKKYNPELINNLAPIVSPVIATAKVVREKYGSNIKVVFIGPCIAAKEEALLYDYGGRVDSVLTFTELRELFAEFNIKEKTLEYSEFNPPIGGKGSLFPISNGILQAVGISEDLLTGQIINTEGSHHFFKAINEFSESVEVLKRHLNLFYCEGCMMGPGTSKGGKTFLRKSAVIDFANKRLKTLDLKNWERNIDEYLGLDFSCKYNEDDKRRPMPSEEEISKVLKIMDKENTHDQEGCGACGYDSCREFAISVVQGLSQLDMCHPYTLNKFNTSIKALELANSELTKIQSALEDSQKQTKIEHEESKEASEIAIALLQKIPSGIVMADANLKVITANESFIDLIGDDARLVADVIPGLVGADLKTLVTPHLYKLFSFVMSNNDSIMNRDMQIGDQIYTVSVFTIKQDKIVGGIIRDLQVPEVRKEEVITRVTDVIDEQLALVQKIGFLLGEGAAKTEKMLNSIIETYKLGKGKDE